uniref:Salivary apyrase n=1 Tax=Triatoma matogrossensis TaxID=162370 RepID=E2J7A6_9HEMI
MYLKKNIYLSFYTIFMAIAALKAEFRLTILHTNDMHSRIEETDNKTGNCNEGEQCYGGFARVAHVVKRIRKETRNTLFLNAGDTYQGTPIYSLFKWRPFAKLVPMLGIDAMSFGNHEFDDGIDGLVPYLQEIKKKNIPVVTCNIDTTQEPSLKNETSLEPWHMFTVDNVKIAVIGFITPNTKFVSCPGNIQFLDEIEKINEYAEKAKNEGANLIFVVGHSGFDKDQEIAKKVPLVDVVVGGHSDSFLYSGPPPDIDQPVAEYPKMIEQTSGKKVPVVQAYGYTKYLGKLDLVWDANFTLKSAVGNPILLNSSVCKDKEVEEETLKWTSKLSELLGERKGASRVLLNGTCRLNECSMGNFITDALIHYVVNETKGDKTWTDAPIALFNSGAIRSSIEPTDNVTWGHLIATLPFDKQIARLSMNGSTLLKALRRSVQNYHQRRKGKGSGEFLQYSGLKVYYVKNATGHLFLSRALARCKNCSVPRYYTVAEDKMYSVVTTLFLSDGGDGYTMFRDEAKREQVYEEVDLKIVAKYLEQMSPVYTGLQARIIISNPLPTLNLNNSKEVVSTGKKD